MKYQYYIASRYRNRDRVLELAQAIRKQNKSVYCFPESDASLRHVGKLDVNPETAMREFESLSEWQKNDAVREVFETDLSALRDAETFILLLPAGKSAHIEAGIAYGMKKKLVLIGEQKDAESLYLIFQESYPSIDAFIKSLER